MGNHLTNPIKHGFTSICFDQSQLLEPTCGRDLYEFRGGGVRSAGQDDESQPGPMLQAKNDVSAASCDCAGKVMFVTG
ncbi:hypothetical protein RRG08_008719 [Elysia crispata]|uniref:Uncharacterized protein n=1 Tax=Elysia crispata TaxID=231223 RepID=A0AAE0XPQ6_9GAST|nr:hypothetical protein RRG08_008719 [Elysia crispata]